MDTWLFAFVSVVVVSLLSLVGVLTLSVQKKYIRKAILYLVSFAVGALFGDALIHLLPEAFENIGSSLTVSLLVLSGIVIFFVLEKFVCWRHCHIIESEKHYHPVVVMNLVGDFIHNFLDGIIIGASYVVSIPLGLATTIAVVLHEIPQEIGDFGVLIHGGLSVKKALLYNFFSALAALLGLFLVFAFGSFASSFSIYLLPVAAGGFLYIAGSDLIPELKHETKIAASIGQLLAIILGIGVMMALLLIE
jgi:zinc and cadmium transporter